MRYLNIATAVAVVILAYLHLSNDDVEQLQLKFENLEQTYEKQAADLTAANNELAFLRQKTKELEENSLQGIAEKANSNLFKGLGGVLDSVGRELKKAQETIEKNLQQNPQKKDNVTAAPDNQQPKRT